MNSVQRVDPTGLAFAAIAARAASAVRSTAPALTVVSGLRLGHHADATGQFFERRRVVERHHKI